MSGVRIGAEGVSENRALPTLLLDAVRCFGKPPAAGKGEGWTTYAKELEGGGSIMLL